METKDTDLNIKNYAHLGDALWELFIREKTIFLTQNLTKLHKYTVHFVNAGFQAQFFEKIIPFLTENELLLTKRARNIPTSSSRKIDRKLHSISTSLEVLLGYTYLHDREEYNRIIKKSEELIDFEEVLNEQVKR